MEASKIKRGMYVIINDHPCKVINTRRSTNYRYKYDDKYFITGMDMLTHIIYDEIYLARAIIPLCDTTIKEYTLVNIIDQNAQVKDEQGTIISYPCNEDLICIFDLSKTIQVTITTIVQNEVTTSLLTEWKII